MDDPHNIPSPEAAPGVVELAGLLVPGATVTETSHPAPTLAHWNVAVLVDDAEVAREAVIALEGISADDAALGLTVLSPPGATEATSEERAVAATGGQHEGADREGVVRDVAPRALVGGLIGAVVGALVVGIAGFLIADAVGGVAGAVGGALLGAPIGAIWGSFARMGGSDAYRQTFTDPDDPSTFMVSLHTADLERADQAVSRLGAIGHVVRAEFDGEHVRF